MTNKEVKVDLADRPDGNPTLWTATNNEDRPMEFEVATEKGTRVITLVPPGGFIQVITSSKEDANIKYREITGKGAH